MNKDLIQTSKFLSLILRHKPQQFGIVLDVNGWANVNDIMCWWSKKPDYTLEKEVVWDMLNNKILEHY